MVTLCWENTVPVDVYNILARIIIIFIVEGFHHKNVFNESLFYIFGKKGKVRLFDVGQKDGNGNQKY